MTSSYVLFQLLERLFGVKLMGAIEILPWRPCRRVPLSYSYVEGLLDYRGTMYPVYNLVQRLGITGPGPIGFTAREQAPGARGKSIILLDEGGKHFGIAVDTVVKMVKLEEHPAVREKVRGVDPKFVKGCVYDEDHEVMILDFERLFYGG
jgi:purine-binding chemotaxis protein CheW